MSLSSYTPPRENVAAGDASFSVRGLNLDDVALLMTAYQQQLAGAYHAFETMQDAARPHQDLMSQMVLALVLDAPAIAADIIAIAADQPDANKQARLLPFPVQVTALTCVGRLTFEAGGGLGNFLAALAKMGSGLGMTAKSPRLSGGSQETPSNGTEKAGQEIVS